MYPQVIDHLPNLAVPAYDKQVIGSMPVEVRKPKIANKYFAAYFLIAVGGGALRKWVFTGGVVSNLILLLMMAFPLIFLTLKTRFAISPFKEVRLLSILLILLIYHIINPYQKTFFHGILGFFVYAPFWIGIFFMVINTHLFNFYKLRWILVVISISEIILCFIQYTLPSTHFINKYAVERESGIAMVGDAVRVTGTFSFLSGLTAFTVFHAFLCWALLRWKFPTWIFFSMLGAGLILCFMAGSRSGTLVYLGLVAGILWNEFPPQLLLRFIFRYLLPFLLSFLLVLNIGKGPVFDNVNRAIDNFMERTNKLEEKGEQSKRLVWGLHRFENLSNFPEPVFGIGTGATYQGATILFGKSDAVLAFGYYESEFLQVFLEGGIVMLLTRIALIFALLRRLKFGIVMKLFLFICMIYGLPIVFNVYNAAFLSMGIALVYNSLKFDID